MTCVYSMFMKKNDISKSTMEIKYDSKTTFTIQITDETMKKIMKKIYMVILHLQIIKRYDYYIFPYTYYQRNSKNLECSLFNFQKMTPKITPGKYNIILRSDRRSVLITFER